MSLVSSLPTPVANSLCTVSRAEALSQRQQELQDGFGRRFAIWNRSGSLLADGDIEMPAETWTTTIQSFSGRDVQILKRAAGVSWLAIPLPDEQQSQVAVAPFVTSPSDNPPEWTSDDTPWHEEHLLRLAQAVTKGIESNAVNKGLEGEIDQVSHQLSATFEEISLLYGVTQNLRLSQCEEDLAGLVLDWLYECLPAESIAIQLLPVAEDGDVTYRARVESAFMKVGENPLDDKQFEAFTSHLGLKVGSQPFVANTAVTATDEWNFPEIRQVIVTPLSEGENIFGWIAAFNHREDLEFGTIEASLMSSLGAILGIHSGNSELYRQQSEFLASVVQALTSAIDAKDPYTCGHSDRVARISVRLAQEVGLDEDDLNTIYMAGLLHDIGKIGIDDNVLRKPGRLTESEYEHIKLHPELGHRILADIRQFRQVLPAVLHHHEQWDGGGYPHGLVADDIPLIARVVAVADAFDAMTSDRPYRRGMNEENVNQIFRKGAGQQWDANVIAAYFSSLEDIRRICNDERANLGLDVRQWV